MSQRRVQPPFPFQYHIDTRKFPTHQCALWNTIHRKASHILFLFPFSLQVLGYYAINKRFSVGVGTGLSIYEKVLIPLFADAKFLIIKPRKFTPYIECGVGYSFAPNKNVNGGFYLNPSAGVEYSICKSKKLFLALGYESQKLEQLKTQKQSLFIAEFAEKLIHNAISIKIGFMF